MVAPSIEVLRDSIQRFLTFSEIYVAALKTLGEITAALQPIGQERLT